MKRFLAPLALLFGLAVAGSAFAQSNPSVAAACGTMNLPVGYATGNLIQTQNGNLCTNATGGGGGGGTASFTAAAGGTVVTTAGTDKAAAVDLFGAQSVLQKDNTGAYLAVSTSALQTTINNSIQSYIGSKAAGTAAASSALAGGVYNSTPLTLTTTQQASLQLFSKGQLMVGLADSAGVQLDSTQASAVQCGTTTSTMVQCAIASGQPALTSGGALRPPSAASGKEVIAEVSLTTATNTTLLAANANNIAIEVQCNGGPVKISPVGATLTSSAMGTGPAGVILATANALYTPSIASQLAYTAYQSTGGAVVCTVHSWVN